MKHYLCPVCGYNELDTPRIKISPSCGTQFGLTMYSTLCRASRQLAGLREERAGLACYVGNSADRLGLAGAASAHRRVFTDSHVGGDRPPPVRLQVGPAGLRPINRNCYFPTRHVMVCVG
jgi:hypothetical protein